MNNNNPILNLYYLFKRKGVNNDWEVLSYNYNNPSTDTYIYTMYIVSI